MVQFKLKLRTDLNKAVSKVLYLQRVNSEILKGIAIRVSCTRELGMERSEFKPEILNISIICV